MPASDPGVDEAPASGLGSPDNTHGGRTLVLLRHAKAERGDWGLDKDRVLSGRGRAQSAAVGRDLAAQGFLPDVALVSSARRTKQTFNVVAANADWDLQAESLDDLYHAWIEEVIELVRQVDPAANSVLVVGHQPTMSATAAALAGGTSRPDALARLGSGLPTAGRAVLQVDRPWAELTPASAALIAVVTPLA